VPAPGLRRWITYFLTRQIEEGEVEIGRATVLTLLVLERDLPLINSLLR
jgi:hypothetical protein